ncbi:MAG: von Willebrand factor type A domain-containing protein [Ginsengibacter sp.]
MNKILLLLLAVFLLFAAFDKKETITITGNITDEAGSPLVNISVNAGRTSTISDYSGKYKIEIDANEKYLSFAGVGYDTYKVQVNNRKVINIVMKANNNALTEVIVTGYASALKSKSSGKVPGFYITSDTHVRDRRFIPADSEYNTEEYDNIAENDFHKVTDDPLSTFSIDVDAASYSNVRRYINSKQLPPAGAVRIEEMINYFKYQYPQPTGKDPFSINTEISDCPWNKENKLLLIGLQGKNIPVQNLPASNLVFLIDVSGSMMSENKLPLVKASMKLLTDQLREEDRISMVVYAGNAGLVLPPTSGSDKIKIKTAIDALEAGGSTAGGAGIQLAYKTATEHFMNKGNNRIILCTDGDFNVGASSNDDMVRLVEKERNHGIYLTVLGYGMGNYKDSKMEQLADKGNGNHAYIDGINEAKKVLVTEFGGTLFTIAKDVKLQVEFNPEKVAGYRLIGYENRLLNKEDFNDDKKDAGELGSGHTVTALYEIIPAGVQSDFLKSVDSLKYQKNKTEVTTAFNEEMLTIKFRYKAPDKDASELIIHNVIDRQVNINSTSANFRFAAAVADFAMLLRNSKYRGNSSYHQVMQLAKSAVGDDEEGYRGEFINLVKKASRLQSDVGRAEPLNDDMD